MHDSERSPMKHMSKNDFVTTKHFDIDTSQSHRLLMTLIIYMYTLNDCTHTMFSFYFVL